MPPWSQIRPRFPAGSALSVMMQVKPITRLRTTVTRQDGTVVLDGTAVCYTTPLTSGG